MCSIFLVLHTSGNFGFYPWHYEEQIVDKLDPVFFSFLFYLASNYLAWTWTANSVFSSVSWVVALISVKIFVFSLSWLMQVFRGQPVIFLFLFFSLLNALFILWTRLRNVDRICRLRNLCSCDFTTILHKSSNDSSFWTH